ncbi:MAG: ECF transporter S component [Oscillospiraceae bacterium]|nr:ECF transporter S component [Oscillospiraceae bacterium]
MKNNKLAGGKTRKLTLIGIFAAISTVLMFFELPLPFMPPFLKFDPSGVPILLASMLFGPSAAISVTLVKDLIHLLSTTTGGVGELADFLIMSTFSVVVGLIYRKRSDRKGVLLATLAGTATCAVVGALANRYLLIPFFSKMMPLEAIFAACAEINPAIDGLNAYILFGAIPFNLIKGLLLTVFTFLLYRKLEGFLKTYIRP